MIPIVRLFPTEQAARDAVAKLVKDNISSRTIAVINPDYQGATSAIDAAVRDGMIPGVYRKATADALRNGRSVVCVTPPYGKSQSAIRILNRSGAVDTDSLPDYTRDSAAPFSEFLGLPVLTEGRSSLKLARSDFTFSSWFGLGLLSRRATPLSSMFGLKLLSSKTGSRAAGTSVQRMSGKAAPLSSMFGMKLLSSKTGSRAAGSSVQRMSGNAAPFSGFLGLRVLSRRKD